jgi:RNA polymerase sigma-70 factor (ECF subfamily)
MACLQKTRLSLMARIHGEPEDPDVWSDFVATYGPVVLRWCRHHGLQDSDARDVAQDVIVRVWRQAGSFRYDPSLRFRNYLRRVVLTAVSDWSASRKSDRIGTGSTALQTYLGSLPAREELADRFEDAFDMERLAAAMMEVEARVKPSTWAAFRMLAIEQLSGREAAARLGMAHANVYMARMNVQRMISDALRRRETADLAG